ncbi:hypothetical protein A3K78_09145 [Candidatus Bathyarchaeota archaeon RBG_13_52_12]|nr:MAG: hypothetical protein A3K78_09145 [Candidatus Bathyarchaeota archaeon RBG_13_52_12]
MNFGICDIRKHEDKTPSRYVEIFFNNNLKEEVVLIGHSKDGNDILGVTKDDINPIKHEYLLWIYACYSANGLCSHLSKKGYITIGFEKKAITYKNSNPSEIEYIEKSTVTYRSMNQKDIEKDLKLKMYHCAKEQFQQKKYLLGIIINYNRLILKVT